MLFRFILMSLSCVLVASCSAKAELKVPQTLDNQQSAKKISLPVDKSVDMDQQELTKGNAKSQKYSALTGSNYMTLEQTGQFNSLGNPLYKLHLFADGQEVGWYLAESGRAYTQSRDRDRSGTEAPLPDGDYRIARYEVPSSVPEVGGRFLAINPLFPTGRSALGIHWDPSFNKNNGEDGTSGCVGLTNREDLSQVLEYVHRYHPQILRVDINGSVAKAPQGRND